MQRIMRMGMQPALAVAALLVVVGCAAKSPVEQLVENRSRYEAEVNSFFVDEVPVEAELPMEEPTEGEPEGEPAEEGEVMEMAPVEVKQRATLDLLVRHDSAEKLPGITIDLIMVDADRNEKGRWLVWVDTSKVERANPTQYEHVLEDLDYVEGDGFTAEVRRPIAESERGDYREFDGLEG